MALLKTLSDLIGTAQSYFKIGIGGVRLVNNSGGLQVKNTGGTAFTNIGAHTLEIQGSNASNKVTMTAPAGLSGNVALTLPSGVGSNGQFLQSGGDGTMSWAASVANAVACMEEAFTEATSSPLTVGTPSNNSIIVRVEIEVSSGASAGSPTISVGIAGTAERDMAASENDLKTAGLYVVEPMTAVGETADAVIATISADGQTFSGKVRVYFGVPS